MTDTKRLGAQSRCWIAPVGTQPDEPGWQPLGWASLDGFETPEQAAAYATENYCIPQRLLVGAEPGSREIKLSQLELSQELIDLYFGKTTERSKPLGITRDYVYDDEDGAYIATHPKEGGKPEDVVALIEVPDGVMPYVRASNSVPLALNILGYDRPSAELFAAGPTTYNGHTANRVIPSSQGDRDAAVAEAIDLLIGADIFDQRQAGKAATEAKRKAEYEASKLASLNRTKAIFEQTLAAAALDGASAESAAEVQAALSAYETARRKYEGLPH